MKKNRNRSQYLYYRVKDFNVLLNLSEEFKKIARTKMNFYVLSAAEAVFFFQHIHVTTIVANDRYPG